MAQDEAAFRQQLEQYAEWEGDRPRIRPIEIPPLVTQHLPWLLPTSRNKMFNAVLDEQSEQPFTGAGYPNRLDLLKENLDLWRPVLKAAQSPVVLPEAGGTTTYQAFVGVFDAKAVVDIIEKSHYIYLYGDRTVRPKVTFYRRLIESGELEDFLVVVPQPATEAVQIKDVGPRTLISRERRRGRGGKFGEMTVERQRSVVTDFVDGHPAEVVHSEYTPTRWRDASVRGPGVETRLRSLRWRRTWQGRSRTGRDRRVLRVCAVSGAREGPVGSEVPGSRCKPG